MLEARLGNVVRFEDWPSNFDRCFLIEPGGLTGWFEKPGSRRTEEGRPIGHGLFDAPVWLSGRVVAISGMILAGSPAELVHMQAQLTGLRFQESIRLTVDSADGTTWADVKVLDVQTPPDGVTGTEAPFMVQMVAANPRRFGESRLFAGSSVQAFHYGNFDAIPEVTVTGPVSAPYTVASGGRSVTVTQALTSGQTHRIDMSTGWVYRNGVLQSGVTSAVNVFTIPPGLPTVVTGPSSMTVKVTETFI